MEEVFAAHTGIEWNGNTGVVKYGNDANLIVIFYNRAVHSPAKSTAAGRPIYEDQVYVRMHPPAERLNIIDRPATVVEQRRFPVQWAQFQQNKEQIPDGTPIDMLYPEQPSIGAMLKANHVLTIEQCADLSAHAIESIGMGAQRYNNDARKYIEQANKGMGAAQVRKELDDRDREIKVLRQQLETMQGEMQRMRLEGSTGVSLEQVQNLLSGLQGGRPQFPAPGTVPPRGFDAASAQIAATHPTADITRQRKAKPAPAKTPAAPARKRASLKI